MSVESMYEDMKSKLEKVVPDFELRYKAELAEEINQLKKEKNAVILGHNYMEPALYYSIPDFRGDSLDLSRKAAQTDKDIIVFCGVRFMAETAKLLNPTKTVLLPSQKAGCSLAASITAQDVRELRAKYPGVPAVAYVNTYADVKAEVDICCTSSNAQAVVEFAPFRHGDFPAGRVPGAQCGQGHRQAYHFPDLTGRKKLHHSRLPAGRQPGYDDRLAWAMRSA